MASSTQQIVSYLPGSTKPDHGIEIGYEIRDQVLDREQKAMRLLHAAASVIEQIIGDEAAAEAKDVWLSDDNLRKVERIAKLPIGRCAA